MRRISWVTCVSIASLAIACGGEERGGVAAVEEDVTGFEEGEAGAYAEGDVEEEVEEATEEPEVEEVEEAEEFEEGPEAVPSGER
jgi:hypothetical protein